MARRGVDAEVNMVLAAEFNDSLQVVHGGGLCCRWRLGVGSLGGAGFSRWLNVPGNLLAIVMVEVGPWALVLEHLAGAAEENLAEALAVRREPLGLCLLLGAQRLIAEPQGIEADQQAQVRERYPQARPQTGVHQKHIGIEARARACRRVAKLPGIYPKHDLFQGSDAMGMAQVQ